MAHHATTLSHEALEAALAPLTELWTPRARLGSAGRALRTMLYVLRRALAAIEADIRWRATRRELLDLDDHMLSDVGLTRAEILAGILSDRGVAGARPGERPIR